MERDAFNELLKKRGDGEIICTDENATREEKVAMIQKFLEFAIEYMPDADCGIELNCDEDDAEKVDEYMDDEGRVHINCVDLLANKDAIEVAEDYENDEDFAEEIKECGIKNIQFIMHYNYEDDDYVYVDEYFSFSINEDSEMEVYAERGEAVSFDEIEDDDDEDEDDEE